jgi:hypothetical protein
MKLQTVRDLQGPISVQELFTLKHTAIVNLSPFIIKIYVMAVVLMDSRIAQGILCEICDWTLLPGSCLEEHNSGLVHRTLVDAVARLALDKFLEFRDAVISSSRKKK